MHSQWSRIGITYYDVLRMMSTDERRSVIDNRSTSCDQTAANEFDAATAKYKRVLAADSTATGAAVDADSSNIGRLAVFFHS